MGRLNGVHVRHLMDDSEDIMHEFYFILEFCSRDFVTDEIFEHLCRMHANFFVRLMVPYNAYGKFTQPIIGTEGRYSLFLPP